VCDEPRFSAGCQGCRISPPAGRVRGRVVLYGRASKARGPQSIHRNFRSVPGPYGFRNLRARRWSGECHSRRLQGGRNAITDCPTFQRIPIECAEGVGIGRTKAVKSRREPCRLKSPNGAHFQMKNRPARDGSQTTATEIGVPAGGFRREFPVDVRAKMRRMWG